MLEEAKINDLLTQWSSKSTDSVEELRKEYTDNFTSLKSQNTGKPEEYLQQIALSRVSARLRRQFSSNAKKFVGVVISYGSLYNSSKKMLEKAKTENWMNEKGEYVYKDYDWRMDKLIPQEDWQRLVIGVCKLVNDEKGDFRPFTMFVKRELPLPPLNRKMLFRAGLKDDKIPESIWNLGSTSVTSFKSTDEPEVNLKELAAKYFPKNCFRLSQLTPTCAKDNGAPLDIIFTMGTVARVTLTNETKKTNVMEIADMDNMVVDEGSPNITVFMNKNIPLDFGEGSVAFVVGGAMPDQQTPGKVSAINATGIWLELKEAPTTKPTPITPENGTTKEEIESKVEKGW